MHMLDAAVQAVAALDEPLESNFVRKHTQERLAAIEADDPDAWRSATFRIFSSEPGTYQAGVNLAVYASAWQTEAISRIFFSIGTGTPTARTRSGVKRRGRWRPASPQWMLPTTRWSATSTICSTAAATMGRTAA